MDIDTVYIIGAGASVSLGMPTGAQLRDRILDSDPDFDPNPHHYIEREDLERNHAEFISEFRDSQTSTIDEFVASRHGKRFAWLASSLILRILGPLECRDKVARSPDPWVRLAAQRIRDQHARGFIADRFIIFNYDRTVEHAMVNGIARTQGLSTAQVWDQSRTIFSHVHGILANYIPDDGWDSSRFGAKFGALSGDAVIKKSWWGQTTVLWPDACTSIEESAAEWLRTAKSVVFLGFGFARSNLVKLETHIHQNPDVAIAGTAIGLTASTIDRATDVLSGDNRTVRLLKCTCSELLAELAEA